LKPIVPGPEDIYVVTDVFWYLLKEYSTIISSVRRRGTKVALVLYDILPLRYPSLYPEEVPRTFELGIREFLPQCDYCVSISKSTEDDVLEYVSASKLPTRDSIAFRHFHLGLDPESAPHGDMRAAVEAAFLSDCTFLSVGTLEPRKGYAIALDACERAWTSGAEFKFVIIGRYGWRSQALRERILAHPEFGKRLFWFNDANDRELAYSYSRCRALIQSSVAEGFGLPILEAARFGAPVIASDLPVFREIGGSALSFFPIGNEQALADLITRFLALPRVSPKIPSNTWADSMRELTACLSMSERP
jgi:alpha-1,2-rhamnosyltransferase